MYRIVHPFRRGIVRTPSRHGAILRGMLAAVLCGSAAAGAEGDAAKGVDQAAADALRQRAAALVAQAQDQSVVVGKDGWLFLTSELRYLAAGPFWGEAAAKVSRAVKPEWSDPLPAILDFDAQVKKAGAILIFAPVPPKAAIYPDKLPGGDLPSPANRADAAGAQFLDVLRAKGVNVLDLAPAFVAYRAQHGDADAQRLYCKTDSHWSPLACGLTAEWIRQKLDALKRLPPPDGRTYKTSEGAIVCDGDLRQMLADSALPRETLVATTVTDEAGVPVADRRDSPVLLLGDSHLLVFHIGGDMHATGAGLADRLAYRLGCAPDVVGVRGSGASPSRINLLRRGDNLAGKTAVVWVLTAREFTETQGWRLVPVVK